MCFDQTDPSRPSLHVHLARIVLKNLPDTSDPQICEHAASRVAPKAFWYVESSRSTPAVSVQTVRQTAHVQFHIDARDPDAHGHALY